MFSILFTLNSSDNEKWLLRSILDKPQNDFNLDFLFRLFETSESFFLFFIFRFSSFIVCDSFDSSWNICIKIEIEINPAIYSHTNARDKERI